jgi:hypothetical protein
VRASGAALLDEVLEAHGGVERWREAGTIRGRVRSGGFLVRTRIPGNRFADYELVVDVARRRAVLDPYPGNGRRGVFDRGEARIETDGGEVIESRANPRAAFSGTSGVRRNLRWDPLDATYFAGYAMWNYLTMPYLLTLDGVEVREGEPWRQDGETWRRLEATFPDDGIDTHSPEQSFYFDPRRLLRRHDYVARVVGSWAHAAHYCADHAESSGLIFPTRRWVRPIGPRNRSLPFPTMVWLALSDIVVEA